MTTLSGETLVIRIEFTASVTYAYNSDKLTFIRNLENNRDASLEADCSLVFFNSRSSFSAMRRNRQILAENLEAANVIACNAPGAFPRDVIAYFGNLLPRGRREFDLEHLSILIIVDETCKHLVYRQSRRWVRLERFQAADTFRIHPVDKFVVRQLFKESVGKK